MAPALLAGGHVLRCSRLYADEPLPSPDEFDALIVMGGPMNVDEHARYPWLSAEKALIATAIAKGKRVLGICLGAQLIAAALGAAVTRNANREVGWLELRLNDAGRSAPMFAGFPGRFVGFHWHGDTFAIPAGAQLLMSSEACVNQAFVYGEQVVAIQFHLEVTAANARAWFAQEQPPPSPPYVQPAQQVLGDYDAFAANNRLMFTLLRNWLA